VFYLYSFLQPQIAFPWMQLGFIGILEIEQLLHLWDRLLGFMDTTLLAIAAVGIFIHRSEMLMKVRNCAVIFFWIDQLFGKQCTTEADATLVLLEGSRIHIITVIQMVLLKDSRHA
jgi:hypothetical protein